MLKISQDSTKTGNVERYVLYFFTPAQAGSTYIVYRAVTDFDTVATETRVFILAFDIFIKNNTLVSDSPIE